VNFEETPMTDEEYDKSLMGKMKKGSSVHKKPKTKMEQDIGNALVGNV